LATRERLVGLYSHHCGRPAEEVAAAKERDRFMTPQQALEFGLIDQVVSTRDEAGNRDGGAQDK
jgi:ATP-dependent Clp protease protease subunit